MVVALNHLHKQYYISNLKISIHIFIFFSSRVLQDRLRETVFQQPAEMLSRRLVFSEGMRNPSDRPKKNQRQLNKYV